jgi:hypothetical protein
MMRLWERNDAPHVDGAPGASGAHPYLVLCHRPPEEPCGSAAPGEASSEIDDAIYDEHESDYDDGDRRRTAVVYQWVKIPR